jgi:CBS domain containing-hemolysin-like protein
VVSVAADDSYLDLRRTFTTHRFSRYPLLDAQGEPVGIVHIKDVLLINANDGFNRHLREAAHDLITLDGDEPVLDLLKDFRQGASHFAVVLGHDHHPVGFLTLEDILETLLGEITDEHERERSQQVSRRVQKLKDGSWLARGDTALFRIERALGQPLPGSPAHNTLSGWLMAGLGHMPRPGETFSTQHWQFEVQVAHGPRIERVRIRAL